MSLRVGTMPWECCSNARESTLGPSEDHWLAVHFPQTIGHSGNAHTTTNTNGVRDRAEFSEISLTYF